jgi:hypothetical protein
MYKNCRKDRVGSSVFPNIEDFFLKVRPGKMSCVDGFYKWIMERKNTNEQGGLRQHAGFHSYVAAGK